MNLFLTTIVLFFTINLVSADLTNGVFYVDSAVECHLLSSEGYAETNHLVSGRTYMIGNAIAEMNITNSTDFYLSGVGLLEAGTNSMFSLAIFDQQVENLADNTSRALFGMHNISVMLNKGEFSIVYYGGSNSSFTISTPLASYELVGGKYFFRVGQSDIAYVLEGSIQVHGDGKRVDKIEKGKRVLSVPMSDSSSGISDKVISNIKSLSSNDSTRFATPILEADKRTDNIQFFIVNGHVIGIRMR